MDDLEAYEAEKRKRTIQQNKAMHKYFRLLAESLNDSGLTIQRTLTKPLDIPWTEGAIKELIWKPVESAMYQKEKTSELEKPEVSEIYETINRHLSQTFGVHVPFPTRDEE